MKFSFDQKFLQKFYQIRFIQHQNFMLSRVEHEKTFIIMGPYLTSVRDKKMRNDYFTLETRVVM